MRNLTIDSCAVLRLGELRAPRMRLYPVCSAQQPPQGRHKPLYRRPKEAPPHIALRQKLDGSVTPTQAATAVLEHRGGVESFTEHEVCLALEAFARLTCDRPLGTGRSKAAKALGELRQRIAELAPHCSANTVASAMSSLARIAEGEAGGDGWDEVYIALGGRGAEVADDLKPLGMQMVVRAFAQVGLPQIWPVACRAP